MTHNEALNLKEGDFIFHREPNKEFNGIVYEVLDRFDMHVETRAAIVIKGSNTMEQFNTPLYKIELKDLVFKTFRLMAPGEAELLML